tara:strand:- start:338 stop:682 length:345 start_codon:yes stop_codon:yes gene_type:complete
MSEFKNAEIIGLPMYNKDVTISELEQQLKETRKHLAESVAKECKCEVNISVNNDLVNRNLELKQQIKEANKVAEFYAYSIEREMLKHDEYDLFYSMKNTGKTAREYLTKYKVKE